MTEPWNALKMSCRLTVVFVDQHSIQKITQFAILKNSKITQLQ
jgi:hypothetical protein